MLVKIGEILGYYSVYKMFAFCLTYRTFTLAYDKTKTLFAQSRLKKFAASWRQAATALQKYLEWIFVPVIGIDGQVSEKP